jgi:uncharacterized protein
MVEIPKKIKKAVRNYVKELSRDIPIEKAVLFGSYAKGNFNKDSDIDLAIFSDYFKDMKRVDGIRFLLHKAIRYPDFDLQPVPFTISDYQERDDFVAEVLKDGIEINVNENILSQ